MYELFPGFLDKEDIYNAAEAYWKNAIDRIINRSDEVWADWFSNIYLNGQPIRNGNPILSKICLNQRRGLRIIQIPYDKYESEITAFIDSYSGEYGDILNMVIYCVLTDRSAKIADLLIEEWILNNKSKDDMEACINNVISIINPANSAD